MEDLEGQVLRQEERDGRVKVLNDPRTPLSSIDIPERLERLEILVSQ